MNETQFNNFMKTYEMHLRGFLVKFKTRRHQLDTWYEADAFFTLDMAYDELIRRKVIIDERDMYDAIISLGIHEKSQLSAFKENFRINKDIPNKKTKKSIRL